jgi:hypothetical protein
MTGTTCENCHKAFEAGYEEAEKAYHARIAEMEAEVAQRRAFMDEYRAELVEVAATNARLVGALRGLVDGCVAAFGSRSYGAVLTSAWAHGVNYTGPKIDTQLAAAQEALGDEPAPSMPMGREASS